MRYLIKDKNPNSFIKGSELIIDDRETISIELKQDGIRHIQYLDKDDFNELIDTLLFIKQKNNL